MNKRTMRFAAISTLLSLGLLINGCQEVGPNINLGNNRTVASSTYIESPVQTPEPRNVLIEEITGVSCNNCPAGHVILENLITSTGGHVIGVSYHIGGAIFNQDALPPNTKQDMTSTDAQNIVKYVTSEGFPGYGPAGAVDRVFHPNAGPFSITSIWDAPTNWSGYTTSELASSNPTQVNIALSNIYNAATKKLSITAVLHYTATQTDSDRLSIFLTEDSIVTSQLFPSSLDTNYIHKHIMRAAVTNPLGDNISVPSFVAGRVDSVNYTFTLSAADSLWKPEHMNVVAFVHKYQNNRTDILQAKTVKVIP